MSRVFDQFPLLHHSEAVGSGGVVPVFELLQQAAYPDLKEFVQIAGGYGQKFHAFEQRIAEIPGFFEHARIKFQPRFFAVEEGGAIAQNLPDHIVKIVEEECLSCCGNTKVFYQGIKTSYQGIALAMPQTEKSVARSGAHPPSTFSALPQALLRSCFGAVCNDEPHFGPVGPPQEQMMFINAALNS